MSIVYCSTIQFRNSQFFLPNMVRRRCAAHCIPKHPYANIEVKMSSWLWLSKKMETKHIQLPGLCVEALLYFDSALKFLRKSVITVFGTKMLPSTSFGMYSDHSGFYFNLHSSDNACILQKRIS